MNWKHIHLPQLDTNDDGKLIKSGTANDPNAKEWTWQANCSCNTLTQYFQVCDRCNVASQFCHVFITFQSSFMTSKCQPDSFALLNYMSVWDKNHQHMHSGQIIHVVIIKFNWWVIVITSTDAKDDVISWATRIRFEAQFVTLETVWFEHH